MATSPKFTLLPTDYLRSRPPGSEITMQSLIDTSEALAQEAREVLPYSFDECTYSKGYLRQSIWSCIDCGEKGVCYGCSISCHSEHKLVELWTKRHFRCDCPTTSMSSIRPTGKRHKCSLNPPEQQLQQVNEENAYSKNFKGEFCRCGREYDAETEKEAMINCMGCEDWYHESCLNLSISDDTSKTAKVEEGDNDEDDEETGRVLIPSESYDGLICASCVQGNPYIRSRAGQSGWMIIEPTESEGVYTVLGRPAKTEDEKPNEAVANDSNSKIGARNSTKHDRAEEGSDGDGAEGKRAKLEQDLSQTAPPEGTNRDTARGEEGEAGVSQTWKGKGDVFLCEGIREALRNQLDAETLASLPFPLVDEEIYEPPQDEEEEETLDQVTSRVVGNLPRVQAIEALHGYQTMKDRLSIMLRARADSGQTVSKEDIDAFFAELRQGQTA